MSANDPHRVLVSTSLHRQVVMKIYECIGFRQVWCRCRCVVSKADDFRSPKRQHPVCFGPPSIIADGESDFGVAPRLYPEAKIAYLKISLLQVLKRRSLLHRMKSLGRGSRRLSSRAKSKKWADLMATNGQFTWPPVGSSVAVYGQFFMAADTASNRA